MASITGTVLAVSGNSGYDNNGGDFDILRDLLVTTDQISETPYAGVGLVNALDTVHNLTVFAPEDDAFKTLAATIAAVTGNTAPTNEAGTIAFLADALTLLGKGDASGLLTDILTYHVASGVFELADIAALGDGAAITTLQGADLTTDLDTTPPSLIDADTGITNPGIITTDISATNGVIHVLDGVLLPVSVSSILTRNNTDMLIGGAGKDTFSTGLGVDYLDGNAGNDILDAGAGDDVAIGGAGNDLVFGSQGDDTLIGESGKDKINGGKGADTINGGEGDDRLMGGRDADTFVFMVGSGHDVISGFEDGSDQIDLSGYAGISGFDDLTFVGGHGGITIELGNGDSIMLTGMPKAELDASDFIFAL